MILYRPIKSKYKYATRTICVYNYIYTNIYIYIKLYIHIYAVLLLTGKTGSPYNDFHLQHSLIKFPHLALKVKPIRLETSLLM